MTKLTIMRGMSGSGKSTWARAQPNAVVVSRDDLRVALFGSDGQDYWQRNDVRQCEEVVTVAEHSTIRAALGAGKDVISDNTNIEPKFMSTIAKIGWEHDADVQIKFMDCSLPVAKAQNKARALSGGRNVPDDVIAKQYKRLQETKNAKLTRPEAQVVVPYEGAPGKPKAFLVDIDGTLAHMRDYRRPFDWKSVHLDDVDDIVADVVQAMWTSGEYQVIVMSGRDEECRDITWRWLEDNGIPFDYLFMRKNKDMRKDNIVKHELFDTHVRDNFDVQFVIDDRWQVCKMWLEMGLKVFNVSGLDRGEF